MKGSDLYLNKKYLIQTGDAIQWRSSTPLGWGIRFFARPPKKYRKIPYFTANHTSLAIIFGEYDQDRRYTTEALNFGIDLNLLSRRLVMYKGEIWVLPLLLEYNHLRKDIGKVALSHMGIGYDYKSLFKQIHERVTVNKKALFCSEHYFISVRSAFRKNELNDLENISKAPRPCDIPLLGIFSEPFRIK